MSKPPSEIVTVVTLYDARSVEHYAGVVLGHVSDEQRSALAKRYDALLEPPDDDDEEDHRLLHFAEVEAQDDPTKLGSLLNIDGGQKGSAP